ncbi:MAG: heme ABC exporter ATP-binding protein CcmA [Pseudomonadota bacterium]
MRSSPRDISVEELTLRRGGRRLFSRLGFRAEPGDVVLLRGPNGCGKSTLLRCLAGLLPIDEGRVVVGGISLAEDREGVQEQLAYAGHLDAVKAPMTVAENLAFWSAAWGSGGDIAAALSRLGLDRIADMPAAYCSAGQKRRLGLARLLVANRPVWLLDEPTVSLDAASVEVFASCVREHCAAGGVAVAATHIDLGLDGTLTVAVDRFAPEDGEPAVQDAETDDPFMSEGEWL